MKYVYLYYLFKRKLHSCFLGKAQLYESVISKEILIQTFTRHVPITMLTVK